MPEIVKPTTIRIGAKGAEELYKLEAERDLLIRKCAEEWLRVLYLDQDHYWTTALPQQLFDILDGHGGSREAARAYLEHDARVRGVDEPVWDDGDTDAQP